MTEEKRVQQPLGRRNGPSGLHHKGCGGLLREGEWREYNFGPGEDYGLIPDLICSKCGDLILGDAQIQEKF